jgi:hypothetical protein
MADSSELAAIQAENARLIALLESHGIEWRVALWGARRTLAA